LVESLILPSLTTLSLCRSEDRVPNIPSATSALLSAVNDERRKGRMPLTSFSLTYGSVWEMNATQGEEDTNSALIDLLSACQSLESLEVHNYSHYHSTLLEELTRKDGDLPLTCPYLSTLHISRCEGSKRGAVRRFVESRVINFDTMPGDATLRPAASACTLKSLIVEGDHDKVVCGSEDIRWIQQHVPHFHIDQYGMLVHRRIILDDDL